MTKLKAIKTTKVKIQELRYALRLLQERYQSNVDKHDEVVYMSNVVSLADFRSKKREQKQPVEGSSEAVQMYFQEVIERNKQVQEKIREERRQKNKRTSKDYNLK